MQMDDRMTEPRVGLGRRVIPPPKGRISAWCVWVIERAEGRRMGRARSRLWPVAEGAGGNQIVGRDADAVGRHRGVVKRGKEEFEEGSWVIFGAWWWYLYSPWLGAVPGVPVGVVSCLGIHVPRDGVDRSR